MVPGTCLIFPGDTGEKSDLMEGWLLYIYEMCLVGFNTNNTAIICKNVDPKQLKLHYFSWGTHNRVQERGNCLQNLFLILLIKLFYGITNAGAIMGIYSAVYYIA